MVLIFAIVAGLLPVYGKAFASGGTDALEGLSWVAKPSGSTDSTDSFRTAAYGSGKIVATGTPPMPFPDCALQGTCGNREVDMHAGSLYRTSTTGAGWSALTTGVNHEIRSLVSGGPAGFVGVGYSQSIRYGQQSYHGKIMTSDDGIEWKESETLPGELGTTLYGVTYGSAGYVAVGASNDINFNQTQVILTSGNGSSWSQYLMTSGALNAVAFGGGTYVAVGSGGAILSSTNGVNWTPQSSGVTTTLRGVTYGNGLFVAVGNGGKILTSPDGANWTTIIPPVSGTFYGAAFGDGTFIVVGGNGTILSSPDGQSWQQRASGTTVVLYGAAYVNGEFMALGANGTILMAQHKLTYAADSNGTISGDALQGVRTGGSGTEVTAVGNTGYHFASWSDNYADAARTDKDITGDLSVTASFAINVYELTYAAGPNGSLTGDKSQSVTHGGNATTVTAVADLGYHFVGWSDGYTNASRTDSNVTGTLNVTALFAIDTYKLTYTANPGGSIDGQASRVQTVDFGSDSQEVTATPDPGYHFVSWSDGIETPNRVERDVRADKTAAASFALNEYTLTYAAAEGGTLDGQTSQKVTHGSNGSEVTAVPNPGYSFVGWSDGVATASRTDLSVVSNKSVTATFTINQYTLTYTVGTGGSINQDAAQTVDYGKDGKTVTPVADEGYHFAGWSDGLLTASRQEKNVQASVAVTAVFEINQYDLAYTAGAHGTLTGVTHQTINHGSNGAEVKAVADTGYHFVRWSDGITTASRTDLNVTGNLSAAAEFAIDTFTLTYSAGTGGSVTGDAAQEVNYEADGTEVHAVPAVGYHFTGWSDGVQADTRQDTGIVANLNVTANFAINEYALTYTAGDHGTLTGNKLQTVNHGSDGTEVTAAADTGYHFVRWSDGVTTASRTDLNVTGDLTVTAEFAIDTFTLTYSAGAGGSVTGAATQQINYQANGTEVKAEPAVGYHFIGWSDGIQTDTRQDTLIVADLNVTADFAINEYTLTYTAGDHGTLTGDKLQTVTHGSDGTAVTAVPDAGYRFAGWSDGVGSATRTDLSVNGNLTVTASFAVISSNNGGNSNPASGFEVVIDGKSYRLGELKTSARGEQTVSTLHLSADQLKEILASSDQQVTVVLPIKTGADVAIGEIPGDLLQLLIQKQATLRIETEYAVYALPTGLIDLTKLFNGSVNAKDVTVNVEIGKPTAAMTALTQKAALQNQLNLAVSPVQFSVTVSYGDKKVELSAFASYVERMIAIPDNMAQNPELTAIVVEPNGSVRPVPTKLVSIEGKRYAVINSRTNSLYALVSKSVSFSDMSNHWSKNAVNDMASRLIVGGAGDGLFYPNKAITRAEFAAIIVRALGLRMENGASSFSDVKGSAWYSDDVQTAYSHQLINGYPDGSFHPNDSITREQAMTIIAKAMTLTGIQTDLQESSVNALINAFSDKSKISAWATSGIAACLQAGIVSGQSASILAPVSNITRAEAVVMIQRLLSKSDLI
ncbi:S-layer homology domain-containing protein [Paenibacillus sp. ATY16]|uniref:InlB B-repeat-containing protein n=1 Tax=Paenibacillus sp. ATY16 TaxID=1759312 RepID=UPI0013C327B3|nr:S-layer homology domain-containing protein [Paenibacillus sp. ATY16]MCK9858471.1 S-layer homology domain-containing protein [Paenibacillus sp. ATY16]